jgi:light-regulated signal transduction histidine kinase (bacteriophytochrome)
MPSTRGFGFKNKNFRGFFPKNQIRTSSDRREAESTLLGGKVTLQLLAKIDGHLAVESELGKGAIFTLTLPKQLCAK